MTIHAPEIATAVRIDVLNPRGESDPIREIPLNPRLESLEGKTIGLFTTFKGHWPVILDEIGRQLEERYPDITFERFVYPKHPSAGYQFAEVIEDPDYSDRFREFVAGVDAVIVANGDAGSCTLYLTYNTAAVELLGKPVAMTVWNPLVTNLKSGAVLRGVPALRYVAWDVPDISAVPDYQNYVATIIPKRVSEHLDEIVAALTSPLTEEETRLPPAPEQEPQRIERLTIREVGDHFYANGWSFGFPITPPTPDAVEEMLRGTDLSRDHVVATVPPFNGKATVEKIAINAVMAGCLPTHLPAVIAVVEAMTDPGIWLEGYTCSVAGWAPLVILNGPIISAIDANSGRNLFSPYHRANAAIGHAAGLIVMNIGGVRPGIEDLAAWGHEGRAGMCIAEDESTSWTPLHVHYGLKPSDSAVTLFWPRTRALRRYPEDAAAILAGMCDDCEVFGYDPGCAFLIGPALAEALHAGGYGRAEVTRYLTEYARRPGTEVNLRWMKANHHDHPDVQWPAESSRSVRKFLSATHLPIIVGGGGPRDLAFYAGGGDHGNPICKRIELPAAWDQLVAGYSDRNLSQPLRATRPI